MKVFLGSIGCRLNQSELELLARELRAAGHEIVAAPEHARAAIINSCTVTAAAEADSRQLVHRLQRLGVGEIYLTGCWVSLDGGGEESLPEGVFVVSNRDKMSIAQKYFGATVDGQPDISGRVPLPGKAKRTRAFIKVQEGCDYHCTFCITRVARGKSVSRSLHEIMKDIEAATIADVKEVVLTGTQLGGWGRELPEKQTIAFLVNTILETTSIPRVRLSSIEPWDIHPDFFALLTNPRFCAHLHLPLQSGATNTLHRMRRRMSPAAFQTLVNKIRSFNPHIALTTDIVVGFPGENEEEFAESLQFVQKMNFAGGHVFRYSQRAGTPAAEYPDQVPGLEKRARNEQMRAVLQKSSNQYRDQFLHYTMPVLWERARRIGDAEWMMEGLSTNYLRVQTQSNKDMWNMISWVKLTANAGKYMLGEIV